MRTFARDGNTNDISFGYYSSKADGSVILDANVVSGKEGILAVVESVVKTERGEMALDTTAGIDHVGLLANGQSMMPFWRKDMEEAALGVGHVVSIAGFDVSTDRATGVISYRMTIETDEGEAVADASIGLAKVTSYGSPLPPELTLDRS